MELRGLKLRLPVPPSQPSELDIELMNTIILRLRLLVRSHLGIVVDRPLGRDSIQVLRFVQVTGETERCMS